MGAATCLSCARRTVGSATICARDVSGPLDRPDPQVLQRHGHLGNLVVGRGGVTAAIGHDHAADRDAIPADSPTPACVSLCPVMSCPGEVCVGHICDLGSAEMP